MRGQREGLTSTHASFKPVNNRILSYLDQIESFTVIALEGILLGFF